jgi:integrase
MELGLTDNTFGKYIATLKGFVHAAAQRGHKINKEVNTKEFKVITEDVDKIYLSNDEIKKIYKLNLRKDKRLERVRDVFILDCYLGLRFSDISSLTSKNISEVDGKAIIKMRTQKTGADVVFPIHPTVKKILEKYKNELPNNISNQKTNDFLKEIGELAGIDDNVIVYKTIGGIRKRLEYKKYQLITTHTARRSFATNTFKMGVPTISIMKMTGHLTEESFIRYIRISQEENALALMKHPFFNK